MKYFSLLFFFIYTEFLSAQNPFYINYSVTDGLPSSNIYSVSQDEYGYIWFTTDVGIIKHDGHRFELFNMDKGLSDNEVFQIKRDSKGRYWMMTLNGKTCYIYKGKIYNESNSTLVKKIVSKSFMNDFYEDQNHNIYILYKGGDINKITPNNQVIRIPNSLKKVGKEGIWETNNRLYFFSNLGIYDFQTLKLVLPLNARTEIKSYHNSVGNYFNLFNSLYQVKKNGIPELLVTLPEKVEIINILVEAENKIWICTRNGAYLWENGKLQNHYFKNDSISCMIKDTEGSYWLSTLNRGVLYIPSFDVFNLTNTIKINCIGINEKKEIWFGDDQSKFYILKNGSISEHSIFKNKIPSKINRIRFFDDYTFIAGKSGVMRIDKNGKSEINSCYADDIYQDEKHIYFGCGSSSRIDKKNFTELIDISKVFLFRRTNVISNGKNDNLWIGTGFGLYLFNKKDSITIDFGAKNRLLDNAIKDLYFDKKNDKLYVASISNGIIVLQNGKTVNHFTMLDGLNSNSCNIIKEIKPNTFLIGSNNGLNSIELINDKVRIKNLNPFIGLNNNKINDIGFLDGIIYLATDKGLLSFNQNKIISRKIVPKCLIVNLKNQDKIVLENFTFPYTENDINIEFSGISFINHGELTYYYRLNKSQPWKTSKETQLNFPSIPSGKYKFEVYCVDQLNNKSNISFISFEILPPFWQKIWFISLAFILFSVTLYYFIQFWFKQQQQRFEKENTVIKIERDKANLEKQMIELEQKALRLQMNPHFIFNALNTIKGYYAEGDTENASSYISKFAKLLRMLLENTEQVIPLSKEVEMLKLYIYLNKIRYQNKFDFDFIIDQNLNTDEIAIPTLLLQPMVENAIIHGLSPKHEKGILTVSFLQNSNQLKCIVEDNGVGRSASQKNSLVREPHQSKAVEITKERLHLFDKNIGKSTIEILDLKENDVALGTKIIITIPLIPVW